MPPDLEPANAHDSGDCLSHCTHPDHYYDDDDFTDEELAELRRRMATNGPWITWKEAMNRIGINDTDGSAQL